MKKLAFPSCVAVVGVALFAPLQASAQISAKLMRWADVSADQIAFVYGGDIWIVPRTGGTAMQVTNSPGQEAWPRFSPDGSEIAYSASYNGNTDVYVMPTLGGLPTRVTYQSHGDTMVDWHPDGERLLFASGRESGRQSFNQFYLVSKEGGLPEKLAVPYGELASYSPDGGRLAYITKITENYPFKRYQGGLSSDVLIFDLTTNTAENITENPVNDGKPQWLGDRIYFVSDQGPNFRLNLWAHDVGTGTAAQITQFEDFDIGFMSAGPDAVVFEAGGQLYLMEDATQEYAPVDVDVVTDLSAEMPRSIDVSGSVDNMTASPGGKRVVFETRGELFNVPVKEGFTMNMTRSSGAFDRDPAWSPDGEHVAYWSDASGEYEIHLAPADGEGEARRLTSRRGGYGYRLYWSPDSEKIAFIDHTNDINVVDVDSGDLAVAGNNNWNVGHGGRQGYPIAWSPDSRWIAFTTGGDNAQNVVNVYDVQAGTSHQVTSGFYNDDNPVFSADGKYLFYVTNRDMSAAYSSLGDGTWVYPNAGQLAAIPLAPDTPSLLRARNDEVPGNGDAGSAGGPDEDEGDGPDEEADAAVQIDFTDMESRLVVLPPDAGNIGNLIAFEGKLVYRRFANTGSGGGPPRLMFYDLESREEETIMANVSAVTPTADGKALLVRSGPRFGVIQPQPGQEISDAIPTDGLVMDLVPREEWRQIFTDTWRRHRDFFYDPDMHGVDWDALGERYGALIDDARTRWDVTYLQSQLVSELSAGHTYSNPGDVERVAPIFTGYLGIDWAQDSNGYRIERIVRPAPWDTEVRSPFDRPGVDVGEGDYIVAVNGAPLDPAKDPYAALEGLSGETVQVTVSRTGSMADAEHYVVEALTQGEETQLRFLEWIENNRKRVEELSGGALGYIYMVNTGGRGQLDLVRMFYGQLDKQGFIIDERFNQGGQLADRFLELLQRPVVYNLHWRHGKDHQQPIKQNGGPMGMLINGWAGSGGDGLPWAFQELEAGPIVGERTLGILVGPATGHQLIDGGGITVPGARLYDNDGHWFWEGEGVSPDIEVWDDPNLLVQGRDPQVERVVQEVMELLRVNPPVMTPAPEREDRSARGMQRRGGDGR
ncbi:MAG: PDZ domain-containing protein [Gemmatimonadota bacterium]|nr:PDZ domain-containing protein [Gemmatimonadota bacterium]